MLAEFFTRRQVVGLRPRPEPWHRASLCSVRRNTSRAGGHVDAHAQASGLGERESQQLHPLRAEILDVAAFEPLRPVDGNDVHAAQAGPVITLQFPREIIGIARRWPSTTSTSKVGRWPSAAATRNRRQTHDRAAHRGAFVPPAILLHNTIRSPPAYWAITIAPARVLLGLTSE